MKNNGAGELGFTSFDCMGIVYDIVVDILVDTSRIFPAHDDILFGIEIFDMTANSFAIIPIMLRSAGNQRCAAA